MFVCSLQKEVFKYSISSLMPIIVTLLSLGIGGADPKINNLLPQTIVKMSVSLYNTSYFRKQLLIVIICQQHCKMSRILDRMR